MVKLISVCKLFPILREDILFFFVFWPEALLHLLLRTRQYGEVVLPDDSTGQSPGTLAPPAGGSRCKPAWLTSVRQAGYGMRFCSPGTKPAEFYVFRGTKFRASRRKSHGMQGFIKKKFRRVAPLRRSEA